MRKSASLRARRANSPRRRGLPVSGRAFLLVLTATGLAAGLPAAHAQAIDVSAETIECSGEVGFASFSADRLARITEGWCDDPNNPGTKLQTVYLESAGGPGQYDLLWVTRDEARAIMDQVRTIRDAKLTRLVRPDFVVERETVVDRRSSGPGSAGSVAGADAAPPAIDLIDPPIGEPASDTDLEIPAGVDSRVIVGRVDAPAGLLSLSVNGQSAAVDSQGLFRVDVPLRAGETPVTIVAVDSVGRSRTLRLRFRTAGIE